MGGFWQTFTGSFGKETVLRLVSFLLSCSVLFCPVRTLLLLDLLSCTAPILSRSVQPFHVLILSVCLVFNFLPFSITLIIFLEAIFDIFHDFFSILFTIFLILSLFSIECQHVSTFNIINFYQVIIPLNIYKINYVLLFQIPSDGRWKAECMQKIP